MPSDFRLTTADSSQRATSPGPSSSSWRASTRQSGTRCCSASPAAARRSRSRTSSSSTGRPTLILAPNKTLAAQLYGEMRDLFPENAVEYFVSYYDYYQPEAYIPSTDTYIEKDAIINDEIDRMRHAATHALLSRRDVIIVASVSCIYGIGSAESYHGLLIELDKGEELRRDDAAPPARRHPVRAQRRRLPPRHASACAATWSRSSRPTKRRRPSASSSSATRSRRSKRSTRCAARCKGSLDRYAIYPGSHYVTPQQQMRTRDRRASAKSSASASTSTTRRGASSRSSASSSARCTTSRCIEQMGFCNGHRELLAPPLGPQSRASRRRRSSTTSRKDFLIVIDESHQTVPQVGAMYRGDRARKETLVEYGFRLPSALDNRPLKFEEFEEHVRQAIYVSATPGDYELDEDRRASSSSRSSARRASSIPRSRCGPVAGPGRRPARRDPRPRRRRTSACS